MLGEGLTWTGNRAKHVVARILRVRHREVKRG